MSSITYDGNGLKAFELLRKEYGGPQAFTLQDMTFALQEKKLIWEKENGERAKTGEKAGNPFSLLFVPPAVSGGMDVNMKKDAVTITIIFVALFLAVPIMLLSNLRPKADYTMIKVNVSEGDVRGGRASELLANDSDVFLKISQESGNRLKRGTYILRLNEDMKILDAYHFPWYASTDFGISNEQTLVIYAKKSGPYISMIRTALLLRAKMSNTQI